MDFPESVHYGWQPTALASHSVALPTPVVLPPPSLAQRQTGSFSPAAQAVAYTRVGGKKVSSHGTSESERGWPEALRKYVEKVFASAHEGSQRQQVQKHLRDIISNAQKNGELWTKDWAAEPLPVNEAALASYALAYKQQQQQQQQQHHTSEIIGANVLSHTNVRRLHKRSLSPGSEVFQVKVGKKKRGKASEHTTNVSYVTVREDQREQARARRFGTGNAFSSWTQEKQDSQRKEHLWEASNEAVELASIKSGNVKGTNTTLEKSYFRLTSKPDPATVRPKHVLQKALTRLVELLRAKRVSYFYASDQFKGMRQDCTVQHIKDDLSASIYEAHARSALENGDLGEYNQCQGQLLQHYEAGITGCRGEFQAYRILYQTVHAGRENRVALLTCLQSLSREDVQNFAVQHALKVREAFAAGNFSQICKLYAAAPNMGRALLDIALPKVRFVALTIMVRAYLPVLPIAVITNRLGFYNAGGSQKHALSCVPPTSQLEGCTSPAFAGQYCSEVNVQSAMHRCKTWLEEHGAVLLLLQGTEGGLVIDCKLSGARVHQKECSVGGSQGPDLVIDDFLTKILH